MYKARRLRELNSFLKNRCCRRVVCQVSTFRLFDFSTFESSASSSAAQPLTALRAECGLHPVVFLAARTDPTPASRGRRQKGNNRHHADHENLLTFQTQETGEEHSHGNTILCAMDRHERAQSHEYQHATANNALKGGLQCVRRFEKKLLLICKANYK